MKRLLTVLLAGIALMPSHAVAASSTQVTGGGRGTVDGATAFSQFGFGISIAPGGSAQGHFNCLMAGSSLFPDPQFQPLMKVDGQVNSGVPGTGTAVFFGSGTLNLGPSGTFPAEFSVVVTEGGPGTGTLTLTVLSPRLGPAPVTLPTETVMHGGITIH